MIGFRRHWRTVALMGMAAIVILLFATGRLEFRWRPGEGASGHEHAHESEKEKEAEEGNRVSGDKAIFDAESLRGSAIRTAAAEKGSVAVLLQVNGEVHVPDERMAHITPRIGGVVREIYKTRGEAVSAGAGLAVIESAEFGEAKAAYVGSLTDLRLAEAHLSHWQRQREQGFEVGSDTAPFAGCLELDQALGELRAARTEESLARRALERMKQLHDGGLRSRTELLSAEADERKAAARTEAAARRLNVLGAIATAEANRARQRRDAALSKLRALSVDAAEITKLEAEGAREVSSRAVIRSPIAGLVVDRKLTMGETVEATSRVFSVADLSEVWITAALFEKDVAVVRQGMPATVRVQGLPEATFRGRVFQLGPQVDEKTRTMPVRIAVPNRALPGTREPYALRPGMFATAELETSRRPGTVVVPTSAVQTLAGQAVVFVETPLSEGAAFQRRPVVLGARDNEVVEVLEGVEAGERVVVANAYLLKSEFERSKISHGHAH